MDKTPKSIQLTAALHAYLVSHGTPPDEIECELIDETHALGNIAVMQIAPEQGAFMGLLVKLMGARKIVEFGTFTGYSALAMALAVHIPSDSSRPTIQEQLGFGINGLLPAVSRVSRSHLLKVASRRLQGQCGVPGVSLCNHTEASIADRCAGEGSLSATALMRSGSATEVPPYFCTIRAMVTNRLNGLARHQMARRECGPYVITSDAEMREIKFVASGATCSPSHSASA